MVDLAANHSLDRVYAHTKERNVGILTAYRAEHPEVENKSRNANLAHDIRKAGYGLIHIKGRYVENKGSSDERAVNGHSFLVIGKQGHDSGQLKHHLKQWGQKYGQDSVLHKSHDSEDAHLIRTREEREWPKYGYEQNVGKFHPSKIPIFYSVMKGQHKTFALMKDDEKESVSATSLDGNVDDVWESLRFLTPIRFSSRDEREF